MTTLVFLPRVGVPASAGFAEPNCDKPAKAGTPTPAKGVCKLTENALDSQLRFLYFPIENVGASHVF